MTTQKMRQFIEFLMKNNLVWAPQKNNGELIFDLVDKASDVVLSNELPLHSFKKVLVPSHEVLFKYKKDQIDDTQETVNQVLFGVTVVDLKAITFLKQVFANDSYFAQRYKKTLVIGHSLTPTDNYQFFITRFKENILEHLRFDIFLAIRGKNIEVYTGSRDGQRVLDRFGYKNYRHIEYVGPIAESGPDQQTIKIREKFYDNPQIWEELGKKCIECGKCTIVCPTCFCFDVFDQPGLKESEGERCRHWTTCFYTDFSEVAGQEIDQKKPKFLLKTSDRIKFWYEHKFVRCVDEFSIPGCVGCGRCTKVCPVGIDIKETLQKIIKGKIK